MEKTYYITNNKNCLAIDSHQNIITVSDRKKAQIFSYTKANNVMNNLKNSLKNLGYYIKEYKTEEEEIKEIANETSSEYCIKEEEIDIDEIIKVIENFENTIQLLFFIRPIAYSQLSNIDKQIEDILHACEFYSYDACTGFKMYKQLHEARIRRRKIKRILIITNLIEQYYGDNIDNYCVSEKVKNQLSTKYHPRELKELFKEEDIFE